MFEALKRAKNLKKNERLSGPEQYQTNSEGRGIIDLNIKDESEIFSSFNPNNDRLISSDLDAYLLEKADAINFKKDLSIHIFMENLTLSKKNEIDRAIRKNFEKEIYEDNRRLERISKFSLYILLVGLIAFGIYILCQFKNAPFVLTTIAEIATWVFVWEAVNSFFMQRQQIKIERLKKYRLLNATIEFFDINKTEEKIEETSNDI